MDEGVRQLSGSLGRARASGQVRHPKLAALIAALSGSGVPIRFSNYSVELTVCHC